MKKTFPIIFTLITLSIAGILFIQITWVQGLMILARNQLNDKVNQSAVDVSNEASKKFKSGISFRFPKTPQGLNDDFQVHSFDPSVANIYNDKELGELIQEALNKHGLNDLKVDYALADKTGIIRLKSCQFYNFYTDTSSNTLQVRVSVIPEDDLIELAGPFETIIIIVPKVRSYILHDLQWIILGAILFILIVLAAFFITVRSLVTQRKLN